MKRFLMTLAIGALAVFATQWQTRGAVLQSPDGSPSHRFEELADGVYFATGTGSMTTMSNNLVIINDDHVMLVDSSVSPAAARGLVEGVKTLTDKPIKIRVQHALSLRSRAREPDLRRRRRDHRARLRSRAARDGRPHPAHQPFVHRGDSKPDRADEGAYRRDDRHRPSASVWRCSCASRRAHWEALQETRPTPPNVTYSDTLTLVKGGREVQLHFPGRGHTGGDTLVFLPEERVVFTGDFFVGSPGGHGLPYMGDGYVEEWPAALDRLKGLQFDVMVPGHGMPFGEREQIDHLQAYLRDLHRQVTSLHAQGVSAPGCGCAGGPERPRGSLRSTCRACRSPCGAADVRAVAGQDAEVSALRSQKSEKSGEPQCPE